MKNSLLLFLTSVLISNVLFSQKELHTDENVMVTQIFFEDDKERKNEQVLFALENDIFTASYLGGRSYIITHYDGQMNEKARRACHTPEILPQKTRLTDVFTANGKCYGLFYREDPQSTFEAFISEWDHQALKFDENLRTISSIDNPELAKKAGDANLTISKSSDGSKVLISHKLMNDSKADNYRLTVLDEKLNLISQDDLTFVHNDEPIAFNIFIGLNGNQERIPWCEYSYSPFIIDQNGVISAYGHVGNGKTGAHVITIFEGKSRIEQVESAVDNYAWGRVILGHNSSSNYFVVLTHDKSKSQDFVQLFEISKAGLGQQITLPIERNVAADFQGLPPKKKEKLVSKGKHLALDYLQAQYLHVSEQGNIVMAWEAVYHSVEYVAEKYRDYWNAKGTIILTASPEGKLENSLAIRKHHKFRVEYFYGSYYLVNNEKLMVFFNDNADNLRSSWPGHPVHIVVGPSSQIALTTFDLNTLKASKRTKAWSSKSSNNLMLDPSSTLIKINDSRYVGWTSWKGKRAMFNFDLN